MNIKMMYRRDDCMSDFVETNGRALTVMSCFGIGPGFGEKTIDEVCNSHGIDTETFLAVINTIFDDGHEAACDISKVRVEALLDYLTGTHDYYLDFLFPALRLELAKVWEGPGSDLFRALIHHYDDFVEEVRKHSKREERELFPYVRSLASGQSKSPPRLDCSRERHYRILMRLRELKRVLVKYSPARDTNRINGVLLNVYNCEYDLVSHNRVEEMLLAPIVADLELKIEQVMA